MANIFTSWKTTLVGLSGFVMAGLGAVKGPILGIDPSTIALVIASLVGVFSKDAGVTGAK